MNDWEIKKQYQALKLGDQWTIGEISGDAIIINDGIYAYYKWETKEAAEKAAQSYNEYEGSEWLGQHGFIFESDLDDYEEEMIELYRLFGAIK